MKKDQVVILEKRGVILVSGEDSKAVSYTHLTLPTSPKV